jgi:hypothetical protein
MRVIYPLGELEQAGTVSGLDTAGVFVEGPAAEGRLRLRLEAEGLVFDLPGQVVNSVPEGFAFVFDALPVDTLERLSALLRTGPASVSPAGEPAPEPGLAIQGEDWTPPVTEPSLHQWVPERTPLKPGRAEGEVRGWMGLTTLTPSPEPEPETARPPPPVEAVPAPAPRSTARVQIQATSRKVPAEALQTPAPGPAGAERRQQERHEHSIPVAFDNLTSLIKEFTHNISFGGMFVYTHQQLPKGTTTEVTLIHPVSGERLSLEARVAHSAKAPSPDPHTGQIRFGLGLEFVLPTEQLKPVLSSFISAHQRTEGEAPGAQVVLEARALLARGTDSPHRLLDLPEDAGPERVRAAYFQLVDRFHPDRHYGKVDPAERQVLEELFRRLTRAYQELTA